jgi:predicted membrane-bound spermidine synthase
LDRGRIQHRDVETIMLDERTTEPGERMPGLGVLLVCFFVSGAVGLVYEVVWLRMLGLVFGHTVYAITTVLAAFMAGLALGSLLSCEW